MLFQNNFVSLHQEITKGDYNMIKKRKPKLCYPKCNHVYQQSAQPYRNVFVKVKSVNKIGREDELGNATYEVIYTFDEIDYYHDVYGDKEFVNMITSNGKPYEDGKRYEWQLSIDC